jgi:hypothetical protein
LLKKENWLCVEKFHLCEEVCHFMENIFTLLLSLLFYLVQLSVSEKDGFMCVPAQACPPWSPLALPKAGKPLEGAPRGASHREATKRSGYKKTGKQESLLSGLRIAASE